MMSLSEHQIKTTGAGMDAVCEEQGSPVLRSPLPHPPFSLWKESVVRKEMEDEPVTIFSILSVSYSP
jgi:hypothetical protein